MSGIVIWSTFLVGFGPLIIKELAPFVSNPTPTPSIEASMRKQNGFENSFVMLSVETKAQLFKAAKSFFSSVIGVPIAQSPLPGGKNFMLKMRSYIS